MVIDSELLEVLKNLVVDNEVVRVRRLVSEPTQTPYNDDIIRETIALHPLVDRNDREPFYTCPTTISLEWVPTWDLYAAAADIWTEKAAAVACKVDFDADGVDVKRSDLHTHYLAQARFCASRRLATSIALVAQERADKNKTYIVGNAVY